MLKEFRDFIVRGNVIDLAVAVVIGAALGAIVKSLVDNVIMPPIGLALGGIDFSNLYIMLKQGISPGPYASLGDAQTAGAVTLNYGLFVNAVVTFVIIAFVIFMIIRSLNRIQRPKVAPAPTTRECPYCKTTISLAATRCPNCTSQLQAAQGPHPDPSPGE